MTKWTKLLGFVSHYIFVADAIKKMKTKDKKAKKERTKKNI